MKIFILGHSGSGKTTYAKKFTNRHSWQYVSAGEWAAKSCIYTGTDCAERARVLTDYSLSRLRENPSTGLDYLAQHYDLTKDTMVDSVRNPRDFVYLFNPKEDQAYFFNYLNNPVLPTEFEEKGLQVIRGYLAWLSTTGMIHAYQYQEVSFEKLEEIPMLC